ncbi:MAG: alpha-mannosidase, partial [Bacteroidia bacterium]|nr:alpha-mannosidase [Bacteroidia bacterium]
ELNYLDGQYIIYYKVDNENSEIKYEPNSSIWIKKSSKLKARIKFLNRNVIYSDWAEAEFFKFSNNYVLALNSKYNPQYSAGGDKGILDGLKGDADWRKGRWQGYQGQDFEVVLDAKISTKIDTLILGTLQDTRSWIIFPKEILVFGSNDSNDFKLIGTYSNNIADSMMTSLRKDFLIPCDGQSYRYFKIIAKQYGKLPDWHPGAGGESFIFVDEIEILSR